MKVLVAVALFAFVALQVYGWSIPTNGTSDGEEYPKRIMLLDPIETKMSEGVPLPEEEKKEEAALAASPSPAPEVTSEVAAPAEVKSEAPSSDAPAAAAAPAASPAAAAASETPAPVEEKKP